MYAKFPLKVQYVVYLFKLAGILGSMHQTTNLLTAQLRLDGRSLSAALFHRGRARCHNMLD